MVRRARRKALLALSILALAPIWVTGCGEDNPAGPGGGPIANPSFAADIRPIFNSPTCATSSCHAPPTIQNGLNLAGVTRSDLVGVTALSGNVLVIAGDAQNSYIVRKLEGRNIADERMPLNAGPLPSATIQTIRNWID